MVNPLVLSGIIARTAERPWSEARGEIGYLKGTAPLRRGAVACLGREPVRTSGPSKATAQASHI